MPFELTLADLPGGYSVSAARPGEPVHVAFREFISSEDGDHFLRRLEGFPTIVLTQLPAANRPVPSQIDHMLVLVHRDRKCQVYINELVVIGEALAKRDLAAGQMVFDDDLGGIRRIKFQGVEIPRDAGFFYLFSSGWRKALYYDLGPLRVDGAQDRDYDTEVLLAHFYTYLLFQDRLKISDAAWTNLLAQGWFPFLPLGAALVRDMLNYANEGWNVDELLPRISAEVRASVNRWIQKWQKQDFFSPHTEVLSKAIERFEANDYVSAVSIIYPRIEGVMRTYHAAMRPTVSQSQKELVASNTTPRAGHESLLLLPERFRLYLADVYFAAFDPKNPSGVSRHTIAHGVAPQDAFSEKAAVIGLLLVEQLSYYYAE